MRLVDVVSDDDNDVAIVGDKIRKLPASFWTQVGKHRPVEIPNFEQCRFRLRGRDHIGRLQQMGRDDLAAAFEVWRRQLLA